MQLVLTHNLDIKVVHNFCAFKPWILTFGNYKCVGLKDLGKLIFIVW